jgi:hypothetical protein
MGWRDVTQYHALVPFRCLCWSRPLKLVSQSHGGQCRGVCGCFRSLTNTLRFVVRVQLQRRFVVFPLKRIRGCNRHPRSFTVLLVLARVLQGKLTARDSRTVSLMVIPAVLRANGRSKPVQGPGRRLLRMSSPDARSMARWSFRTLPLLMLEMRPTRLPGLSRSRQNS